MKVKPFQLYGNSLGQMLSVVKEVLVGKTVNIKVAALSHPTLFVRCAICVPDPVNVKPFHLYGNALGQMLRVVVEVLVGNTVNTKVAALSQPTLLVRCAVCVPAPVKVNPFQTKGNALGQILESVVEVLVGNTVNTKVAALSQPTLLVRCAVCEPAPVKVRPFHVYGNALGQMLILLDEVLVGNTVNTKVAALSQPTLLVR